MFLGLLIVFIVLCLLILLLKVFGLIATKSINKQENSTTQENNLISSKESAAISMALHLYYDDVHDDESYVLTIKSPNNRYSSWNSKIYGINNY
jgi:Na+-transporting methylmalonyl-CoA/oxaloacetate decarboxylase gamma subunit